MHLDRERAAWRRGHVRTEQIDGQSNIVLELSRAWLWECGFRWDGQNGYTLNRPCSSKRR